MRKGMSCHAPSVRGRQRSPHALSRHTLASVYKIFCTLEIHSASRVCAQVALMLHTLRSLLAHIQL
jgi:hypothetical protein